MSKSYKIILSYVKHNNYSKRALPSAVFCSTLINFVNSDSLTNSKNMTQQADRFRTVNEIWVKNETHSFLRQKVLKTLKLLTFLLNPPQITFNFN